MEGKFETQFENEPHRKEQIDNIETRGGTIKVLDIEPEKQKTQIPTLFIPGWGETFNTLRDSVMALADKGRRSLSLSHPRFGALPQLPQELLATYPKYQLVKALNVLEVLQQKGVTKSDVVAHSSGAIDAAIATSMRPEQFRNLVLFAPGGMMGKEKALDVTSRLWVNLEKFFRQIGEDPEASPYLIRAGTETAKYVLKNPTRAFLELVHAFGSKSDISKILEVLHEQGLKIAIVHGVDDAALPMQKIQAIAKRGMLDGFYSVRGGHQEIYAQPQKYMDAVDKILDALEAKSIKTNDE